jgi:hypothetical protein
MPGDPKECRAHALRCCELAHAARTEDARQHLLHLAGTWNKLAFELETTHALLKAVDAMEPKQGSPKQEAGLRQRASRNVLAPERSW